jgi:nitroimidazol reductase NimA-like FMN-containing flavoprotein (pyridoxamine 5'-phosphate oxidase superfamily)
MPAHPTATLDARFSDPRADARPWDAAERLLTEAELYWLTTVKAGGRPHVTPLLGVWSSGRFHFSTGPTEQKARNLGANRACAVTTGRNDWAVGTDVVVEGVAEEVTDEGRLTELAEAWVAKYGEGWRFEVRDGAFFHEEGGRAGVFAVAPAKAFAFGKGEPFSQTTYRFAP